MKFKQLGTGVILEVNNEFVIGQLKKSTDYEVVTEFTKKEKVEDKVEKNNKKKND